jgi:hypothetical protein
MSGLNATLNEVPIRDPNGRFVPGQSGNPAGKKPGTRNRATMLREALNEGEDRMAARVVIDKALAGNLVAARFVVDRLTPRPRGREITLDLAEIGGPRDIVTAYDATVKAMAEGEITPDEALTVTRVLDGRLRALTALRKEARKPAEAKESPSPLAGEGRGEGVGAGQVTQRQQPPHPPIAGAMGPSLSREGRGSFPQDLLHSTCISTSPGWRFGLAA